jgi:hypothetical protein
MIKFDIHSAEYAVSGLRTFSLSEALRLWKAKFETIHHFKRGVINHPGLDELGEFVAEVWEDIQPVTVQEAFEEKNMEKRRVMFDCIGVAKLFAEMQPVLLDRQVLSKTCNRWDGQNRPYQYQFDDVYELYKMDGEKLFSARNEWSRPPNVYAVRCWCTTTGREYWIYVPSTAALGEDETGVLAQPDAIRAIAWTIVLDITHPKRLFRQGDIVVAEESPDSEEVDSYHLSKEDYLRLIFSET